LGRREGEGRGMSEKDKGGRGKTGRGREEGGREGKREREK
jgi:hypothetical protein